MGFAELKRALFAKYFSFLNDRQLEAVMSTEGPLLVLAGAGSGKTTVIVNRIANLVLFGSLSEREDIEPTPATLEMMQYALDSGNRIAVESVLKSLTADSVAPRRILCITFTNKAANEFKSRLSDMLGESAKDIWAGTFHSICVRILRRFIDRLGYKNDFTIYDTDDAKKLITQILKEQNIPESMLPPRAVLSAISKSKESERTPNDELLDAGRDVRAGKLAQVYSAYQSRLKESNALDFDDIIMLTNRLFESNPDVLERYREQFSHILVDEYQDTNISQSKLISLLAGKRRNICVVGDDDQSIYSFRGATVENILGFDRSFSGAKTVRLEQNYRSTGNILAAANGIIANNESRLGKELWTSAPDGEKIKLKRFFTQVEESTFICDTIAKKVAEGAKYSDFAILYRVNALSNTLETMFVKKKLPYKIFGGIRFYERKEVKDILAYLSVIANRADSVRLMRIVNVPKRSIGNTTVERVATLSEENGISMFEIMQKATTYPDLKRGAIKLESFCGLIEDMADYASKNSVSDTVSYVIEQSGYRVMLADEDGGREREENILELVSSAKLFEETAENPTLSEFLNEISLVSDLDSLDSSNDAVVMMTVHSAKGLEFPTVFIPGFEEGLFPSGQSIGEGDRGLQEERRLAYVAVTRAKNELYLLNTSSRLLYGRTEVRQLSRFAGEIPESVCAREIVRDGGGYSVTANAIAGNYAQKHAESRNHFLESVRAGSEKPRTAEIIPVGTTVEHAIFGRGEVISATPMGGDILFEIEFTSGAVKRLMGNFAKLKTVE